MKMVAPTWRGNNGTARLSCKSTCQRNPARGGRTMSWHSIPEGCHGMAWQATGTANEWLPALKQLQNLGYEDIRGRLEISYQALNPHEKEIFLDIACFFLTEERSFLFHDLEMMKKNMISFWESLYDAPDLAIENLMLKSLIVEARGCTASITERAGENPFLAVPMNGTERVRGLCFVPESLAKLAFDSIVTLHQESLARMPNLQLLWLREGTRLEGDIEEISSNLRWLRWEACPLKRFPSKWNNQHPLVLELYLVNKL
eukprot:Gb_23544 [translate_table: standard]